MPAVFRGGHPSSRCQRVLALWTHARHRGRTCGTSEIGAEEGADRARGFVFFHYQCTEGAASGGPLYLLYGGFDRSPDTTAAVGGEVAEALRGQGLTVDWDGDPGQAIRVTGLDWRKRLTG
ncbi:DUF6891 domain-containing protein [Streptomyces sp. NPDC059071]|uniref:DUF6891 domain-containing protein n=1 Tax=unclassified Streptomyces TaxID=2593676 RepID=UPI003662C7AC